MKRISLLLLFIGLFLNGQTFELEWSKTYGGSDYEYGRRIFKTPDGGYMAFGVTSSTDGDISNPQPERTIWVIKMDSEGNKLWDKTLKSSSGHYLNFFNIHEVPGTGFLVPAFHLQERQSFLIMTDYDINILWEEYLNHIHTQYQNIIDVIPALNGGYISTVNFQSVKKLNQNFEIEWVYNDVSSAIQTAYELPDESIIIRRQISPSTGDYAGLVKLSKDGEFLWEYSHPTDIWLFDVKYTSDNNLIAVGLADLFPYEDDDFDLDYIIIKMTLEGEVIWTKHYGGTWSDWARHIHERDEGGYIVAGRSQSFDGDVSHNYGLFDYWVIVLDENGDLQCEKSFGGSKNDDTNHVYWRTDMVPAHDEGYVFISSSESSDYDVPENKGGFDYWVFKTNIDFEECGNMSVIDTNHQTEVSIYPNPVENGINIKAGKAMIQKIQLYDMTGRVILEKEVNSKSEFRFDLTKNVTKGNYILKVITDKGVRSFKILKNK